MAQTALHDTPAAGGTHDDTEEEQGTLSQLRASGSADTLKQSCCSFATSQFAQTLLGADDKHLFVLLPHNGLEKSHLVSEQHTVKSISNVFIGF